MLKRIELLEGESPSIKDFRDKLNEIINTLNDSVVLCSANKCRYYAITSPLLAPCAVCKGYSHFKYKDGQMPTGIYIEG